MPTVYVTAPRESATETAETIVEERLAACVNRLECTSTYRWEGDVHTEPETVLLAKTTEGGADALTDRVAELHPDDVPCIERFDEAAELERVADWKADAVE